MLCEGDPVPSTSNVFLDLSHLAVDPHGSLAFHGRDGSGVGQIYHLSNAGVLTEIARDTPVLALDLNSGGMLTYAAGSKLFSAALDGSFETIFSGGDPLPDDPSLEFVDSFRVAISETGAIVFAAYTRRPLVHPDDGPTVVYLYAGGQFTRLATGGQPLGASIPGTVAGPVSFAFTPEGVLFAEFQIVSGARTNTIARWTGVEWIEAISAHPGLSLKLRGASGIEDLLYSAGANGVGHSLYLRRLGRTSLLGRPGDLAPDSGGGTVLAFFGGSGPEVPGALSAAGWASAALIDGSSVQRAIYAPEPAAGAAAASALLALAAICAGTRRSA